MNEQPLTADSFHFNEVFGEPAIIDPRANPNQRIKPSG